MKAALFRKNREFFLIQSFLVHFFYVFYVHIKINVEYSSFIDRALLA